MRGDPISSEHRMIQLTIDDSTLLSYENYYFAVHNKAHKKPIAHPYHESMNTWMVMRRPMMNALKQRWKDFIRWYVEEQGYANLRISKCEVHQIIYYPTNRRHDTDNSTPKFILDGLVESGMVVDDDSCHITKLILECAVDKEHPRTELYINILPDELKEGSIDG
jgi:hypothetical protein